MQDIVLSSSGNLEELPVTPFRFDPGCRTKPSWFEVVCIADNVRYQYGFSATPQEVIDEWLYAWPSGRMQVWLERSRGVTPGTSTWTLGGKLTGDRQVWRRATRSRALFLSTAVTLSLKYEAVYLHDLEDGFVAQRVIAQWIGFYNEQRPHSALAGRTPAEAYRDGVAEREEEVA